jgi:hypothetical protein
MMIDLRDPSVQKMAAKPQASSHGAPVYISHGAAPAVLLRRTGLGWAGPLARACWVGSVASPVPDDGGLDLPGNYRRSSLLVVCAKAAYRRADSVMHQYMS